MVIIWTTLCMYVKTFVIPIKCTVPKSQPQRYNRHVEVLPCGIDQWLRPAYSPMQAITFFSIFSILTACSPPLGSRLALRINALLYKNFKRMVETMRIELTTPCVQSRCSPNWAMSPHFICTRVQLYPSFSFICTDSYGAFSNCVVDTEREDPNTP